MSCYSCQSSGVVEALVVTAVVLIPIAVGSDNYKWNNSSMQSVLYNVCTSSFPPGEEKKSQHWLCRTNSSLVQ